MTGWPKRMVALTAGVKLGQTSANSLWEEDKPFGSNTGQTHDASVAHVVGTVGCSKFSKAQRFTTDDNEGGNSLSSIQNYFKDYAGIDETRVSTYSADASGNPDASGRGLSFTLAPSWGNETSGTGRLWSARDATSLAVGENVEAGGRLEATVGYGMPVLGGGFTGTPEFGLGFSESGRDWRLGWRLGLAGSGRGAFGFGVEATRREPAGDDAPETRLGMTATMRW